MSHSSSLTAVVAGGAGQVGEGIVRVLLNAGATVIAPTRSAERAALLRSLMPAETHARLRTDVVDVGEPRGAAEYARTLAAAGLRYRLVVASLGGWWGGAALHAMPPDDWSAVLANNLTSHYAVAHAFAPHLLEYGGSYVTINGAAAHQPVPGSGVISVVAAAQVMLARVLAAELGPAVRVHQVMIASLVASPRSRWGSPPAALTPDDVGRAVLDCARGRVADSTVTLTGPG